MILPTPLANKVFDIVVQHAGAREDMREQFVHYVTEDTIGWHEFRFAGKLGFGGKFRMAYSSFKCPFYVTCYSEDETDERRKMITLTKCSARRSLQHPPP